MSEIMGFTAETSIEEAVFQALGAASVCWESIEGTRVFDTDTAKQVGNELVQLIYDRLGEAYGEGFDAGYAPDDT